MNKVLVTGAAGFIASHTIEFFLSKGIKIVGVDNFDSFYSKRAKKTNLENYINHKNFNFFELDICDRKSLFEIDDDFDIVIHIAAKAGVRPSIQAPNDYLETNIAGTQNILDFMKQKGCKKILFASSSSIYGNNKKTPFSEYDNVDRPISPYAFTKKANELQIHSYHHLYNINAICLRFFTVYGPRQRPDLAIRKFIEKIDKNETIDLYGDGTTGRDYTYVSDTVLGIFSAYNYLIDNESTKVYEIINIGNNKPVLLKEMINIIFNTLGKSSPINKMPMQAGDVLQTCADISKAEKLLNYSPKVSFEEGVNKFVNWFNKNKK